MIIKPSATLRNDYSGISKIAHETQEPIYITKNGEGDLVVMSIDTFEKMEDVIRLRHKIYQAEKSRLDGEPTFTPEEAMERLERKYEQ